jgi:hypothetical protein
MRDGRSSDAEKVTGHQMPRGITPVGIFLFFGATMASLAGTTLTWPGTSLDRMWALNPTAHKQLGTFAQTSGNSFFCSCRNIGARRDRAGSNSAFGGGDWLWLLSRPRFLGDLVNFFKGDYWRGGVGFSIATALLLYLLRPAVRGVFNGALLP